MRFYLPGPSFPDSFVDNVAVTLQALGHEAITDPPALPTTLSARVRTAVRFATERVLGERPSPKDLHVRASCMRLRPDVLLALTWDVHPEVLRDLRVKRGIRSVLWWADTPSNSRRFGLLNKEWEAIFVKDRFCISALGLAGLKAHYLVEAMNPLWHRPVDGAPSDGIAIAGNLYNMRQAIVERLVKTGVRVDLYGPHPPAWSLKPIRESWRGEYIVRERKSAVFRGALACLNTFSLAEGNSLNCRAFEIAGAGGLQMIHYRPAIAECFEPGKELLVFDTFEGLVELMARARRDVRLANKVRNAGARRALSEHTYRHRLEAILRELQ